MTERPSARPTTLAALRKRAGITQPQIAAAMGISESRVSRIEGDFPDVAYPRLQAYLKAIGAKMIITDEWDPEDVWAEDVIADPARQAASQRRKNDRQRDPSRRASDQRSPKN